MMICEELSIGEVARRTGLRPSALRYYESIGLLPAPVRLNGRRRYNSAVVQMVAVIQLAQQAGFTIAEIQTLFHGFTRETLGWGTLARARGTQASGSGCPDSAGERDEADPWGTAPVRLSHS